MQFTMNSEQAIVESKTIRQQADQLLQRIKAFKDDLRTLQEEIDIDKGEAIAQCTISQRDLESTIMRQGMVLKAVGRANPYPQSFNPESLAVEPTADGLVL